MASAYPIDVLLENSTLAVGTPWEHLCSQEGGTSGGVCIDGIGPSTADVSDNVVSANVNDVVTSASVDDITLDANINEVLSTSVKDEILTSEVCP